MGDNILVVEDEETLRRNISTFLVDQGHDVSCTASKSDALTQIEKGSFDLVLTDIRLEDGNGLDLIKEVSGFPTAPVVMVMTAYSTIESAVNAFRMGACDYLIKPVSLEELGQRVSNIARYRNLSRLNASLRQEIERQNPTNIIFRSKTMAALVRMMQRIAPSPSNVLITGESGTGKELVARGIHDLSPNKEKPFIALNVAAIPDTLMESYLFGHRRGAFTGADRSRDGAFRSASDGTLFLDEIGDLPLHLQPKLLRALEEKEIHPVGTEVPFKVNTRVLAATHRNLDEMVEKGTFRQDLLMRLNVLEIRIPPLRQRMEDVPLLARHFIGQHCHEMGIQVADIEEQAMKYLMAYNWRKGNIRELSNVIERAVILSENGAISSADLPAEIRDTSQHVPLTLKDAILQFEYRHVASVLESVDGNREEAAQVLAISPATLYRHLERLGLKGYQPETH